MIAATVAAGDVFPVKAFITHIMETGLRRDDMGEVIPRKIIHRFVCRYAGVVVFSADLHESVSANPYLEFRLRATESGVIEFIWEEDGGAVSRLEHRLTVV